MFTKDQIEELVDFLCTLDEKTTKIYIGTDSSRFKRQGEWYAKYVSVVVVHVNGNKGCRIFKDIITERVYDMKPGKPSMRLMREVQLTCDLYLELAPFVDAFSEVQIHADINPNENFGSSCVAKEAAGYILGMTGIEASLKPDAFCASFAADHWTH
jgi:predicted RNase H-related nuclease YkuK (DUF458 family)